MFDLNRDTLTRSDSSEIIGDSPKFLDVLEAVRTVAPANCPVLVRGETSTGKEVIARAVHNATMTHDYKRHGTTTLFVALDVLAGKVIGDCYKRHRQQEFLRFLRRINREFPGKRPLHLVMDNYCTHGTPEVKDWLNRRSDNPQRTNGALR